MVGKVDGVVDEQRRCQWWRVGRLDDKVVTTDRQDWKEHVQWLKGGTWVEIVDMRQRR